MLAQRGVARIDHVQQEIRVLRFLEGRAERREEIEIVLDPLLGAGSPDEDRAILVVNVLRAVLAARLVPLFDDGGAA